MDPTMVVTLTPNKDDYPEAGTRTLTVAAGTNIGVGRISDHSKPPRVAAKDNAFFDCRVLSGIHASISSDDGRDVLIEDLGSPNGTFLNDTKLGLDKKEKLSDGDVLIFGRTIKHDNAETRGLMVKVGLANLAADSAVDSGCTESSVRKEFFNIPPPDWAVKNALGPAADDRPKIGGYALNYSTDEDDYALASSSDEDNGGDLSSLASYEDSDDNASDYSDSSTSSISDQDRAARAALAAQSAPLTRELFDGEVHDMYLTFCKSIADASKVLNPKEIEALHARYRLIRDIPGAVLTLPEDDDDIEITDSIYNERVTPAHIMMFREIIKAAKRIRDQDPDLFNEFHPEDKIPFEHTGILYPEDGTSTVEKPKVAFLVEGMHKVADPIGGSTNGKKRKRDDGVSEAETAGIEQQPTSIAAVTATAGEVTQATHGTSEAAAKKAKLVDASRFNLDFAIGVGAGAVLGGAVTFGCLLI